MNQSRMDLTTGPVGRTLFVFSLPVLGSNVLQSLNASINSMWVGHYLGEAALTATSNANIILFFLLGTAFGLSMANTILVGQAVGAKDPIRAKHVVGTSFSFFVALSVTMATIGFMFTPDILQTMGTPTDATPLAIAYLRVIFIAVPFMFLYNVAMMTLRGTGDSRTPFWFMLLSVALDVVLNPMLIFGIGPFPKLGIAGSATATLIAQSFSLAAMLWYLKRHKYFLLLGRGELHCLRPNLDILRTLVAKGVPMGLQMLVISSSAIVMMSLVNRHGSVVTAAYGVASQLWNYMQMPAMALGAGVSSLVAQNVGAGRWDRVSSVARVGVLFNFLMTGVLVAVVLLLDRVVLGLFLPDDDRAMHIARHINLVVTWSFVLFGVTFVLFSVVRATGAVVVPLLMLVVSMWLVRLPVAVWFGRDYGEEAIWWSFPVGAVVSLVLSSTYYRFGGWRRARMEVVAA
jgi:putative MATE family efflux protein